MLDKLDIIPAYRQQAEEIEGYLKEMKGKFEDQNHMKTILDRMLNMISKNKDELPEKPGGREYPIVQGGVGSNNVGNTTQGNQFNQRSVPVVEEQKKQEVVRNSDKRF